MNIIITGSSGFIGTNFIDNADGLNVTEVNLRKQPLTSINFTEIDSVLHLAAVVHQIKGAPDDQYFKINRDLTFKLAKLAKSEGVKQFIFLSTVKVYGESTTGKPALNETSKCDPHDAYGKSKYEAEKLLIGLEDDFFKVSIIRSPLVYGKGVKANMFKLVKLVDRFSILPLGGINNRRSMVYIGNLVALLKHIIITQASGIYMAGDIKPFSTSNLIKLIGKNLNKRIYLFKIPSFILTILLKIKPTMVERIIGSLELDNSCTNQKLAFTPPFESDFGVREMVLWYKTTRKI